MPSATPTMIQSVTMDQFRGIAGLLTVESRPGSLRNSCTLIMGDNGSGKTSICDALEFCLRGAVSRRSAGGEKQRREVKNLSGDLAPFVQITFSEARGRGEDEGCPTFDA